MIRNSLGLMLLLVAGSAALAQAERYDIGRKMIAFEEAWDAQPVEAIRKKTTPIMKPAVAAFFGGKLGEVARLLDEARDTLSLKEPASDKRVWARALVVRPQTRLLDVAAPNLNVRLQRFYDAKAEMPSNAKWIAALESSDANLPPLGKAETRLQMTPMDATLNLVKHRDGDFRLKSTIAVGNQQVYESSCGISLISNLNSRLERLQATVEKLPTEGLIGEQLTLRSHSRLLTSLARGETRETDFPANRLINEAEALAGLAPGAKFFDQSKTGQFWITLATEKGSSPVRLFVPEQAKQGRPIPLVVALHGAGGSENMFFDAYGHGEVVRQCEKRGWLCVATRTELFATPPVVAVVDELAKRYPVDKSKVFLVGHSMGAGQALSLAQQAPDRWAGVAALGGAGRMSKIDAVKNLPIFIACGTEDFALNPARATMKALKDGGCNKAIYKEYSDIEHIVIVQVALPDVFKWYDGLLK